MNEGTIRLEVRTTPEVRAMLASIATTRGLVVTTGKCTGEPAFGAVIAALATEEHARREAQPTLLALAKKEPDKARALMIAALTLAEGNSESARAAMAYVVGRKDPVSERDWRSARDLLKLDAEIRRRWPLKRGPAKESTDPA